MEWTDREIECINALRDIGGWANEFTLGQRGIGIDIADALVMKGAFEKRLFHGACHEKDGGELEYRVVSDLDQRVLSAMMFLENAMDGPVICAKAISMEPMEAVRVAHHLLAGPYSDGYKWAAGQRARVEAESAIEDAAWRPKA